MERKLVYFVSDVHLGLDVKDPAGREARFVQFLRSVPVETTRAIYLLGDIWDFWYEYKYVVPKGYVQVFAAIQDLIAGGVQVFFFQGNHDVWTYHYLEENGMLRLEQPFTVEYDSKKFCIGHGDGLGPVPFGYRFLRGLFHNKTAQFLFSLLHPRIAFALGNAWSKHNRLAHDVTYEFRGVQEPLYKFAQEYSASLEVDYFVFGHYHSEVDMTLDSGARLLILGDWISRSSALCWDGEKMIRL